MSVHILAVTYVNENGPELQSFPFSLLFYIMFVKVWWICPKCVVH